MLQNAVVLLEMLEKDEVSEVLLKSEQVSLCSVKILQDSSIREFKAYDLPILKDPGEDKVGAEFELVLRAGIIQLLR